MNNKSAFIPLALFFLIAAAFFSGCQTMDGFGKDVENAGEAIQEGSK